MDKFVAILLGIFATSFFCLFHIADFSSFIFEYVTLIVVMFVFFVGYETFVPVVRGGFLLLLGNKVFECMEEVQEFQPWLNDHEIIDFLLGDVLALAGIVLIAIGVQLRLSRQKQLLNRDAHTNAYNKFAIERITQTELEKGEKKKRNTSILIVDVDHFKHFNDSHGHQLGDEVLISVKKHLQENIRSSDYLARWGGDEFVITCPNTSESEAIKIMERIQSSATQSLSIKSIPIRLSIGAATSLYSIDTFSRIFREADRALYQVKEQGRNGYKHYQNNDLVSC
ncbi:GGDEF domain-containing protein [Vibrio maerlii]|uniref:GGDEF domain-containing protein n=1 Tax=Vibrio maerlii TaxID=2231648 RepID=UPI000E3D3D4A|nr:GGDEF domain-containing protein [Vibrio maerlii]